MRMTGLTLLLAMAMTMPAAAQEGGLESDLSGVFAPLAHVENVPDTLNCAALFRSLSVLLDPESEAGASFQAREGFMASIAAILWGAEEAEVGTSEDEIFDVLIPPLDAATGLYLSHMNTVAETTDSPFDEVILSRVEYCIAIHDALHEG